MSGLQPTMLVMNTIHIDEYIRNNKSSVHKFKTVIDVEQKDLIFDKLTDSYYYKYKMRNGYADIISNITCNHPTYLGVPNDEHGFIEMYVKDDKINELTLPVRVINYTDYYLYVKLSSPQQIQLSYDEYTIENRKEFLSEPLYDSKTDLLFSSGVFIKRHRV